MLILNDGGRGRASTPLFKQASAESPQLSSTRGKVLRVFGGSQHREAARESEPVTSSCFKGGPQEERHSSESKTNSIEESELSPRRWVAAATVVRRVRWRSRSSAVGGAGVTERKHMVGMQGVS